MPFSCWVHHEGLSDTITRLASFPAVVVAATWLPALCTQSAVLILSSTLLQWAHWARVFNESRSTLIIRRKHLSRLLESFWGFISPQRWVWSSSCLCSLLRWFLTLLRSEVWLMMSNFLMPLWWGRVALGWAALGWCSQWSWVLTSSYSWVVRLPWWGSPSSFNLLRRATKGWICSLTTFVDLSSLSRVVRGMNKMRGLMNSLRWDNLTRSWIETPFSNWALVSRLISFRGRGMTEVWIIEIFCSGLTVQGSD